MNLGSMLQGSGPATAELNEPSDKSPRNATDAFALDNAARRRPATWRSRFLFLLYAVGT